MKKNNQYLIFLWGCFIALFIVLFVECLLPFPPYEEIPEDVICLDCCDYDCWLRAYKLHLWAPLFFYGLISFVLILTCFETYLTIKEGRKEEKNEENKLQKKIFV